MEVDMRRLIWFLLLGLLSITITACGGQSDSGITPAADKLTFLFFYTDN
jgi:hypothetical protein